MGIFTLLILLKKEIKPVFGVTVAAGTQTPGVDVMTIRSKQAHLLKVWMLL